MNQLKDFYPAVAFGTSGVRALVTDLTRPVLSSYVKAFIERLRTTRQMQQMTSVALGIDLRPSSPRIAEDIGLALHQLGLTLEFLGPVPTPALALHCLQKGIPGIMVTGSHIPFDRNGIKFYTSTGEILKDDETAIASTPVDTNNYWLADAKFELPSIVPEARNNYVKRYLSHFGGASLQGMQIGLYEHSAVGRDLTREALEILGANVISLGRSDTFVPIDTEAVSDADLSQAQSWCKDYRLNALVSTDGDGDRPLVFDEQGGFVRGDLLGLLCAQELGVQHLAIPVSCNSAIEKCGAFGSIVRTRIGSPFVIAGMSELATQGYTKMAGFEANGGFLLGTPVAGLSALPTRDALLPMISILAASVRKKKTIAELISQLPSRFTYSDRLKNVATARSQEILARVVSDTEFRQSIFSDKKEVVRFDTIDGVRITFKDGDIAHLRASGNAPELRCYAESDSYPQAKRLCDSTLEHIV